MKLTNRCLEWHSQGKLWKSMRSICMYMFEKLVCFCWTGNWFLSVVSYTFLFLVQFAKGDKQLNDILRDSSVVVPYYVSFCLVPSLMSRCFVGFTYQIRYVSLNGNYCFIILSCNLSSTCQTPLVSCNFLFCAFVMLSCFFSSHVD